MKKRILHYLILAVTLLGLPAFFAWVGGSDEIWEGVKSFPPRTEDWGFHPEKLWNHRHPFCWPWFLVYAGFTFACMFPLVRRAVRAVAAKAKPRAVSGFFPWWGWLGVVLIVVFWYLSWNRFEWARDIQPHISYMPLWAGYILVMNGLCERRRGASPLTRHPLPYLATFPASSLFWWFFEYLNRYTWNWWYQGIGHMGAGEYTLYATICFSSVLPAVVATAAWLHTFAAFQDDGFKGMLKVDFRSWPVVSVLLGIAALGLGGLVFFPQYSCPLLWMSPLAVFLLVQTLLREESAFDCLGKGNWAMPWRFAVAALICGLVWETWNWGAIAKWIYSVPYVQRWQIWEMPLIGFAGYLPFGLECAAVSAWILPALVEDGER